MFAGKCSLQCMRCIHSGPAKQVVQMMPPAAGGGAVGMMMSRISPMSAGQPQAYPPPQSAVVGGGSSNSVTQGQHGLNNPSPSDSPLSKVCNKLSVFIYFLHMLYCSLLFLVRFIIETLFLKMYGNVVVEHTEIP